jgi:hypothetical protein
MKILMIFLLGFIGLFCSMKSGDVNYNSVVTFSKDEVLKFPDFTLEYLGERSEKKEFPNGNSFTFRYYDFKLSAGSETKTISWSSGTGVIDPLPFEISIGKFELELRNSEKLSKKLDENELVIVKK